MNRSTIPTDRPIPRVETGGSRSLDVALIRVPDVSRFQPRPIQAEAWSGGFSVIRRPSRRPRRRLRREIRMTAYACLATLPFVVAAGVWSVHSAARRVGAAEVALMSQAVDEPISNRPLVWLSVEKVEMALDSDANANADANPEPPVSFPGYLLPDDRREEPTQ